MSKGESNGPSPAAVAAFGVFTTSESWHQVSGSNNQRDFDMIQPRSERAARQSFASHQIVSIQEMPTHFSILKLAEKPVVVTIKVNQSLMRVSWLLEVDVKKALQDYYPNVTESFLQDCTSLSHLKWKRQFSLGVHQVPCEEEWCKQEVNVDGKLWIGFIIPKIVTREKQIAF